jgi:5'-phosphate synthase pdxT subunit
VVNVHRVGVLSLQGDFARHAGTLEALGVEPVRVTLPEDLEGVAALVLPGGESTTMTRLLGTTGLRAPVERFVREGPVLGTCAGLILLAARADALPEPPLGVLDVTVRRNAYGRQLDSFIADVDVLSLGRNVHGVFIRAPRIVEVGPGVEVIARLRAPDGNSEEPVGVRSGRVVGLCFHPELTRDPSLHAWFLSEVAGLDLPWREVSGSRSARAAEATR